MRPDFNLLFFYGDHRSQISMSCYSETAQRLTYICWRYKRDIFLNVCVKWQKFEGDKIKTLNFIFEWFLEAQKLMSCTLSIRKMSEKCIFFSLHEVSDYTWSDRTKQLSLPNTSCVPYSWTLSSTLQSLTLLMTEFN